MNKLLFIFLLFWIPLSAEEESIVVQLSTDTKLMPLYLTHLEGDATGFDAAYRNKLEQVLRFDLDHNGMTLVLRSSPEKEKLAGGFETAPKENEWRGVGAFYIVKGRLANKILTIRLFTHQGVKKIETPPLTGYLNQDRREIHRLVDAIHKTLFGTEGIALTRVLYTLKGEKQWSSDVWEIDYDGGNPRKITSEDGFIVTPSYVPPKPGYAAGSCFFVSYITGQPKIYYQNLKSGVRPARLTLLKGNQLMPTMNRQRDKVAFISDVTGNPDLFILPFDPEKGVMGKPYQVFSTHLATQASPTFSPDGRQLAFVSNKDGSPRIYLLDIPAPGMSLSKVKATLLTKRNRESSAPAWSPDGTKLAYCSAVQGTRQIWVYDFTTGEERQVTDGPGNKENPTWAPNSLHLMFNSTDAGACNLFLMNLHQKEVTQITFGPGEKRFPAWEIR